MSPVTAIELVRVTKRFGAVLAVHEVDLGLTGGRVHALVGENGAGKSTLVNILGGVHQPDDGTIVIDGRERTFASPTASRAAGIAVIHQEPALFPHLSVAENVVVGRYPLRRGGASIGGGCGRRRQRCSLVWVPRSTSTRRRARFPSPSNTSRDRPGLVAGGADAGDGRADGR